MAILADAEEEEEVKAERADENEDVAADSDVEADGAQPDSPDSPADSLSSDGSPVIEVRLSPAAISPPNIEHATTPVVAAITPEAVATPAAVTPPGDNALAAALLATALTTPMSCMSKVEELAEADQEQGIELLGMAAAATWAFACLKATLETRAAAAAAAESAANAALPTVTLAADRVLAAAGAAMPTVTLAADKMLAAASAALPAVTFAAEKVAVYTETAKAAAAAAMPTVTLAADKMVTAYAETAKAAVTAAAAAAPVASTAAASAAKPLGAAAAAMVTAPAAPMALALAASAPALGCALTTWGVVVALTAHVASAGVGALANLATRQLSASASAWAAVVAPVLASPVTPTVKPAAVPAPRVTFASPTFASPEVAGTPSGFIAADTPAPSTLRRSVRKRRVSVRLASPKGMGASTPGLPPLQFLDSSSPAAAMTSATPRRSGRIARRKSSSGL